MRSHGAGLCPAARLVGAGTVRAALRVFPGYLLLATPVSTFEVAWEWLLEGAVVIDTLARVSSMVLFSTENEATHGKNLSGI